MTAPRLSLGSSLLFAPLRLGEECGQCKLCLSVACDKEEALWKKRKAEKTSFRPEGVQVHPPDLFDGRYPIAAVSA